VRDRGLEPLHLLDLLGRHASSGGAHVLSRHDGPVRVLEAHVVEVRLLRTKRTLKLADLLLEAHAAAALFYRVFVESFAFLRERHEFIRLRVTAPSLWCIQVLPWAPAGGGAARKRGRRFYK